MGVGGGYGDGLYNLWCKKSWWWFWWCWWRRWRWWWRWFIQPLVQKESYEPNYNKVGGMGHTLPPLSNRFILNGFAAQSRNDIPTQEAIEAVNQVAAAVNNLNHYNKASVLPANIINSPPPPPALTSSSASYEHHMFTRLPQNNITSGFQNGTVFQPRSGRTGFSPSYPHSLHEFSTPIHVEACLEKRTRVDEYIPVRRKPRTSTNPSSYSTNPHNQQLEEVNTKEVAERITAELKKSSIPQAVFARKILSRSQGTLSDLLRNPKPWSKLKSGRDTFRKMWKWLQEPEGRRNQDLRNEGNRIRLNRDNLAKNL